MSCWGDFSGNCPENWLEKGDTLDVGVITWQAN
jgi:hypothetical protein